MKYRCSRCGEVLESLHRHDFRVCGCRAVFVDGGSDYFRWGVFVEGVELIPVADGDGGERS